MAPFHIPLAPGLGELLERLDRQGEANDATETERAKRWLSITPDTGAFLWVLVRSLAARRVLEIGTSMGYSTLWLASAVSGLGGHVTTLERSATKLVGARENLRLGGQEAFVTAHETDATDWLASAPDGAFDLIFLDSERSEYPRWWPDLRRVLRPGGLIVVDNATSHAAEMAPFVAVVEGDAGFATALVPVGKGELLVHALETTSS